MIRIIGLRQTASLNLSHIIFLYDNTLNSIFSIRRFRNNMCRIHRPIARKGSQFNVLKRTIYISNVKELPSGTLP